MISNKINYDHNPWKIVDEKEVYQNPWIKLIHYNVLNPNGNPGIYGKVHFKNASIGCLPIDADMNVYLVGQYRFTLNRWSWEIPTGGGTPFEDPIEAAKRELLEETGIKAEKWTPLVKLYTSNSITDEFGWVYLATDLSFHQPEPEDTEILEVIKIPFEEAYQMVKNGEIMDASSIIGILQFKLNLLEDNKV